MVVHICGVSRVQLCQHEGNQSTLAETLPQTRTSTYQRKLLKAGPSSAGMRATKATKAHQLRRQHQGKTAVMAQIFNDSMYQKDYAIVARKMSQKLVGN